MSKYNDIIQVKYTRHYQGGAAQFIEDYDTAFTEIDALYDTPQWTDATRRDRLLSNLFSDDTKDIVSQCYNKSYDDTVKHLRRWALMQDAHVQRRSTRKAKYVMMEEDEEDEEDVLRQVMNLITGGRHKRRTRTGIEIPPEYDIPPKAFQLIQDIEAKKDFIRRRDAILEQMSKQPGEGAPTKPPEKPPFQPGNQTFSPKAVRAQNQCHYTPRQRDTE